MTETIIAQEGDWREDEGVEERRDQWRKGDAEARKCGRKGRLCVLLDGKRDVFDIPMLIVMNVSINGVPNMELC